MFLNRAWGKFLRKKEAVVLIVFFLCDAVLRMRGWTIFLIRDKERFKVDERLGYGLGNN